MPDKLALFQRIEAMSEEDKQHFQRVVEALSHCYAPDNRRAVLILETPEQELLETITLNCDDAEAYEMVQATQGYLEFINIKDAPPKEKFN